MTIGERIKKRRLEIGMTVDQLSDLIGKNRATIYRYESNEIDYITQYFKSSPSNFIELSQFCKWADVSYTFDKATNTYHITEN